MNDRLDRLKEKLKIWRKEIWLFISSIFFLRNFGFMLATILGFFLLTQLFLTCYTRHGDSVQVDDLLNMSLEEAREIADDKGFELEVVDSSFQLKREGGVILSQTPKPLSRVKKGRRIYLTVSKYESESVQLPLLSESSYEYELYSRKLAKSKYLLKTKIKEEVFDLRQAEGTILYFYYDDQKIEDGDVQEGIEIPKGSLLEFVITTQKSSVVGVPKLVCKQYDAASFLITSRELLVGEIFEDNTVINRSSAFVWKQEPAFATGQIIAKGSKINLHLTQNRPEGCNEDY